MSIFSSIVDRVFHHHAAAAMPPDTALPDSNNVGTATTTRTAGPAAGMEAPRLPIGAAAAPIMPATPPAAPPIAPVDARMVLADLAAKSGQSWNWKESIVDVMKLLGLDSSLEARRSLAHELHYSGDTNDTAAMNVWLHKQVMQRLAENGGTVPPDLR